jgi:FkbM family methyltransferase
MQRLAAANSSSSGALSSPHRARTINGLPDPDDAAKLLTELANDTCSYAPVAADRPLALYGAGKMGLLARAYFMTLGHEPVMVIDRDASRHAQDPVWSGTRLVDPGTAARSANKGLRIAHCVVTAPYVPIERSLLRLGFTDIVPFYDISENYRDRHPLSNGWFAGHLAARDRQMAADVLARWDDDVSRAQHIQFLAWRRLRQEWEFAGAPISGNDRFFIPEVTSVLHGDESFLDAGAHHGVVLKAFVEQTKGAFREIAAIEPDPFNRARLEDNLQSWLPDDKRVRVYDCALADGEGTALFHDGLDYASQLSPTGKTTVTTRPLDALGLSPTFLKLHLEGGELPALQGAQETLLANRPIVVATVYHNADGIWQTPHWLMETLPDYRFLFRIHSWCGTGAVVYAIPKSRRRP